MINLIFGSSNRELAKSLAAQVKANCIGSSIQRLTCGEIKVKVEPEKLQGKCVHILQSITSNDHIMELCLLARAAKNFGAREVVALIPYLGYARQDKNTADGEINALHCLIDMMRACGIEKVIAVDVHIQKGLEHFGMPVINLDITDLFTNLVADLSRSIIIAPDKGAYERANAMAKCLKVAVLTVEKKRLGPGRMKIVSLPESDYVYMHDCYIVDDILDSGGTLCSVARELKKMGANSITAFISHGLFGKGAVASIQESSIDRLYITNSILHNKKEYPKTKILDVSSIIAKYLSREQYV